MSATPTLTILSNIQNAINDQPLTSRDGDHNPQSFFTCNCEAQIHIEVEQVEYLSSKTSLQKTTFRHFAFQRWTEMVQKDLVSELFIEPKGTCPKPTLVDCLWNLCWWNHDNQGTQQDLTSYTSPPP